MYGVSRNLVTAQSTPQYLLNEFGRFVTLNVFLSSINLRFTQFKRFLPTSLSGLISKQRVVFVSVNRDSDILKLPGTFNNP